MATAGRIAFREAFGFGAAKRLLCAAMDQHPRAPREFLVLVLVLVLVLGRW